MNFSKKCKSKYGLGDLFTKIKRKIGVRVFRRIFVTTKNRTFDVIRQNSRRFKFSIN